MTDQKSGFAEFDAYATSYDNAVNESLAFLGMKMDYFTRVKAQYLLDLINLHFDGTDKLDLLDVGCGVGNYHGLLIPHVRSVSGTDLSSECLTQAATRNPRAFYSDYDGNRLPYEDGRFEVVFTICVMHHVPPVQRQRFIAEIRRVTKPRGLAIVFEHNPLNPLTRRVVSNCEFDADAVLLRQRETCQLLRTAGFANVRSRAILSIPSMGKCTRKLDLLLGRLSMGAQYFVQATA